jgi:hypothetical protein
LATSQRGKIKIKIKIGTCFGDMLWSKYDGYNISPPPQNMVILVANNVEEHIDFLFF